MENSARPSAQPPARDPLARWDLPAKYEPRRVIGSGSHGTVLLARDRSLGRLVAIKVLSTDCPDYLERLRREARLLARLDHPSIVRVHELDLHRGRLFLAMEYAAGGNLALRRLAPGDLIRTLRGVVDALAHAHASGIVHRDVKPENLLLRPGASGPPGSLGSPASRGARSSNGAARALLTDFGLAQGLALGDADGSPPARRPIVGTPLCMSPEQVQGLPVGPASDVYSLGVTFYRQLTGRWPFRGRTVIELFQAIREREPEPFGGAPVPRRLQAIVRKSLAKDPRARFASMEDFGQALDAFLRARSMLSFPGRWLRPVPDRPRIHPEDAR